MTANNLPTNVNVAHGRLLLYCNKCANEYSADYNDYHVIDPTEQLQCCDQDLVLCIKKTVIIPYRKQTT